MYGDAFGVQNPDINMFYRATVGASAAETTHTHRLLQPLNSHLLLERIWSVKSVNDKLLVIISIDFFKDNSIVIMFQCLTYDLILYNYVIFILSYYITESINLDH